jgi:Fur family transcriptional regulator, ferric uptake regulator
MERQTRQRAAIQRVFDETNRPLDPVEVLERAQAYVPQLGIATVYRALKSLTEEGHLTTVMLPGENPRYERADLHHHHHFQCRKCQRVFDLTGCPGDVARLSSRDFRALTPTGFTLEDHEIILYGRCDACA